MTEKSLWWTTNATGDGTATGYTMAETIDFFRDTFIHDPTLEGVITASTTYATPLAVTAGATSSHSATVAAGRAWVYGFGYWNTATVTVTLDAEEANPRIDRIVLRASWAAQTTRITAIKGTAAASPTAPAITQTASTTWDIKLAQVRLNADGTIVVTDERTYWKSVNHVAQIADGVFTANAAGRAPFAAGAMSAAEIANRSRSLFVPAVASYNHTTSAQNTRLSINGWPVSNTEHITCDGAFAVSSDFASGMTVKGLVYANGTGNMYSRLTVEYGAVGEDEANHTSNVAIAPVAVTSGDICVVCTSSMTSAAVGDVVSVRWGREAQNALDTVDTGLNYFMGFLVEYTADS